MNRLVVITGLSGSGKSLAARCFEDLGYFCVDNLPVALIPPFCDLIERSAGQLHDAALVIDVREGRFLKEFPDALEHLRRKDAPVKLLFFECSDEVLKRRFSETRRPHPMSATADSLEQAIRREREELDSLRHLADRVIDTSRFTAHELRNFLQNSFGTSKGSGPVVNMLSFGFKYGLPPESDLVFDVRFLPNPYFVETLRARNGTEAEVQAFLDEKPEKRDFVARLKALLAFLMPLYAAEGKSYLTVSLGCTGGKHRSVALAEEVAEHLRSGATTVSVTHRDLGRE